MKELFYLNFSNLTRTYFYIMSDILYNFSNLCYTIFMLKQKTGEVFQKITRVILSVDENRVETIYEGQDPIEVIEQNFWKSRNSEFRLCDMVEQMEVIKFAPGGTFQLLSEAYCRVGEPVLEVVQKFIWTGKAFKV